MDGRQRIKSFGTEVHMLHVAGKKDTCTKEHKANVNHELRKGGSITVHWQMQKCTMPGNLEALKKMLIAK